MKRIGSVFLAALMALSVAGCGKEASDKAADVTVTVEAWGPKSITLDQKTDKQKEALGIWFKLSEAVQPDELEAWVGDRKMSRVRITEQKGAFAVPGRLLEKTGRLPMYLVHVPSGKQIPLGEFEVTPPAGAAPDIAITAWGPKTTFAGEGFNVQKNGASAIWFKMTGAVVPATMEAWFGGKKLEKFTITSGKGGAMQIPQDLIANEGQYPVYLVHKQSKKRYDIGNFIVK